MDRFEQRKKIINAAFDLFLEHGIKAVKMDDIASVMGMSKRTLYEIFGTKESLLKEVIMQSFHRRDQDMQRYIKDAHGDVLKILASIFHAQTEMMTKVNPAFYDDLMSYPDLLSSMDAKQRSRRQNILNFFQQGVDDGIFRPEINYDVLLESFSNMTSTIVDKKIFLKYPLMELYNSLTLVVLRGIMTGEALKRLHVDYDI